MRVVDPNLDRLRVSYSEGAYISVQYTDVTLGEARRLHRFYNAPFWNLLVLRYCPRSLSKANTTSHQAKTAGYRRTGRVPGR